MGKSNRNKPDKSRTSTGAIAINRRALRDYEILETIEAGLVLTGTEIKSIRAGRANIQRAFARSSGGEMWLYEAHIAQYMEGSIYNHAPTRPRKLLLKRNQIIELSDVTAQKGLTLVPLRLYIKSHYAKIQLGLAKGRRQYDKRKVIIDREKEREAGRAMRRIARG